MDSEAFMLVNDSGERESSEQDNSHGFERNFHDEELGSGAGGEARDHIKRIRKSKGLDLPQGQESSANVEDLEKALDVLSDQLYSQPTHFLLEFIQNADDNSYEDERPTISFTSMHGYLHIDCNETGFAPANVEAICRIGKSTKQDRSKGFIGEKGIGFKSVFKIADIVWISSREYTFKFDRAAQLGMIAPIWEDRENFPVAVKSGNSHFCLQLSKEKDSQAEKDLLKQLRLFDSTLLLFLRKLKIIEILVNDRDWMKQFTYHIARSDTRAHGGELITIKKNWTKKKKADETLQYFVVRHNTTDMPIEPKRRGMEASEVVLAFPFIENKPAFHVQKAYAFLPIRDSGFRFLLQADFILIANREDIEKSKEWNERLLTGLAECFVQAVIRFNSAEALVLRHTWLGFLQNVPKSNTNNFTTLTDQIFDRLRGYPVLESQAGNFVRPVGALFVPRAFRDADERFVLNCAGNCQKYISASYENHDKEYVVLKMMGVEIMTFAHFISILKTYMTDHTEAFRDQSADWHSLIANILCEEASNTDLQSLAVIPLQTGRWISKIDGQAHFQTPEAIVAGKIPEGVPELLIVDKVVSEQPQRRKLLDRLGVKNLNQAEVCRLITNCHVSTKAPELTVDAYISHATYLFEATYAGVFSPKGQNFWVLDKDGQSRAAAKMYLDKPDSAHSIATLLDGPSWHSCLLHPAYLMAYKGKKLEKWIKWLEAHLAIRSTVRIAVRGELTPEFQHLRATRPSPMVLEILMESWTKEPSQLTSNVKQQLGGMDVLCEGTEATVHLNKTCLPLPVLKDLAPPGIFYVQLNLPDKPVWKKLREFGVVVEPNLAFYLQCLSLAQGKQVTKIQMTKLYKSIDSHWVENPRLVDEHFAKFDNLAIYVPNHRQWVHRRGCVWESAPGMSGEIILADQYPELQSFFFHRLKIPSATITKVVDELRANAGYDSLEIGRRKDLIFTLSDFLRKSPRDCSKLEALKDVPVMPVADNRYGTSAINIASLNKVWWYFADQHRYHKCFQNKLSFADFRVGDYARLEPLDQAMHRVWSEHHRLSSSVVEERDLGSHPTLDANGTNFLREKVKYFRRIARVANPRHGRDLERTLQRLNLVTLYTSPDMVVRTSIVRGQVGNTMVYGAPIPGKIMLRETKTDIQIYVHPGSMKHGRPPSRDTGEELCKCCGIGDEKMKRLTMEVLLLEDHQEIEDMLSMHKVGGYYENDLEAVPIKVTASNRPPSSNRLGRLPTNVESRSEAQTSSITASNQVPNGDIPTAEPAVVNGIVNQSKPSKMPYQGYASSAPGPEMKSRELKQAARYAEICESIRVGGRENIPPQTYPPNGSGYTAKKAQPNKVVKPTIRPARKSSPNKSPYERPFVMAAGRDQPREEKVGVRGEEAVFNILKDIFGAAIDASAWTSELRHHVHGYKLWIPEDPNTLYSDFTVRDTNGILGKWMLANNVKIPTHWATEGDLLYHIEVKSTAKEYVDDPFFMSHLQMDKAKKMSEPRSENPREVFVIFRVYDVESEVPGLEVYCDPWRMIERGGLTCQTQEWRVSPS